VLNIDPFVFFLHSDTTVSDTVAMTLY